MPQNENEIFGNTQKANMSGSTSQKNTTRKNIFDAVEKNDFRSVKLFVEEQKVPPSSTNGPYLQTAAHIAAQKGYVDILKYLLQKDPAVASVEDKWKQTVLHLSVKRGSLNVIKYLVDEYKVDITKPTGTNSQDTVLHLAASKNHLNIFKYFVEEKGLNVNLKNGLGQPPAFQAAAGNWEDFLKYIVETKNGDVSVIDSLHRNILYKTAEQGSLDIIKYLLDKRNLKFDVNYVDASGDTILHVAAKGHRDHFVQYIVEEKNANVNIRNKEGKSPLYVTAKVGAIKLAHYLLDHGASIQPGELDDIDAQTVQQKDVIAFLQGTLGQRSRRSVPGPWPSVSPVSSETSTSFCKWIERIQMKDPSWPKNRLGSGSTRFADAHSCQVNIFLIFSNAYIRYIQSSRGLGAIREAVPSSQEIADQLALDAIYDPPK